MVICSITRVKDVGLFFWFRWPLLKKIKWVRILKTHREKRPILQVGTYVVGGCLAWGNKLKPKTKNLNIKSILFVYWQESFMWSFVQVKKACCMLFHHLIIVIKTASLIGRRWMKIEVQFNFCCFAPLGIIAYHCSFQWKRNDWYNK